MSLNLSSILSIKRRSSSPPLLVSHAITIATAVVIAIILLASNFTIIKAQPVQQQQMTSQLEAATTTTMFQSTDDSFRVQVASGWVIQDVNNTGLAFFEESRQGYAILAQLCPEQQGSPLISNNTVVGGSISSCQQAQDVIHIIRYPNLETGTQLTTTNITAYHLQKLQEVGYRDIRIVTSTDTTVNVTNPQTGETVITAPAKFVEATYSTNFAPNEIRSGYFILTATNSTVPNVGVTKGYSVFYESSSNSAVGAAGITTPPTSSSSVSSGLLPPAAPLPQAVAHLLSSFELIAAPQVTEQATTVTTQQTEQTVQGGGFGQVIQIECDPSYPSVCIPPPPPDFDCPDIRFSNFTVLSPDPHGLDGNDNDGIGCELPGGSGDDDGEDGDGSEDDDDGGNGDTECDPSYPDFCIPPAPPNLNCDDISGRGFTVLSPDPHGLDGNDNDGIGCEDESNEPDDDDDDNGGGDGEGDDDNGDNEESEPEPEPGGGDGDDSNGGDGGGDDQNGTGDDGGGGEETPPGEEEDDEAAGGAA